MSLVRLKEVADFVNGKAFQPSDWSEDGLPIIRIQNLNGADRPFNYWAGSLERQVQVKQNDLLLAWSGTPGTSFGAHIWRGNAAVLNQHIFRVDLDEALVTREWAKFVVNAQLNTLIGLAHGGVGLKHVTRGMVEELEIPLPSLPEQRRIAAILDQADALRAKRREALAQLDSLTQSIFIEMFGDPARNPRSWPIKRLEELVPSDDTINYGVVQPGDDVEDGVPLVRVGDLIDGHVHHSSLKRIAATIESAYRRSRLKGDEILVSCVGSVGVVALADRSVNGYNIARAVARVRLVNQAGRKYVASHLRSLHTQRYFTSELRTVSQPTLNIKQLSETKIMCPPMQLQEVFAARIEIFERVKAAQQASLASANALFASLQHRAFRGEL